MSYYDDDGSGGPPAAAAEPGEQEDAPKSETTLVPKSIFGEDLKPGDKCDIEVVRVHESEYEIKGCEGHGDGSETPTEAPGPQGGGMESMME